MAAVSEGARNDLYNGLSEVLGRERAETLMSYLPRYDPEAVATHSDIDELRREIAELRTELKGEIAELRTELKGEIAELRTELKGDIAELRTELKGDIAELRTVTSSQAAALLSLQRTLITGFIAMFAAMAGIFVAVL
jgi:ribosomal protein L29